MFEEFPESVNLEKTYFAKHSLRSEVILKSTWMRDGVCHPQNVPEKVNLEWAEFWLVRNPTHFFFKIF